MEIIKVGYFNRHIATARRTMFRRLPIVGFLMRDICVHVPMSLRARTSVPNEWWTVKVTEKYQDL